MMSIFLEKTEILSEIMNNYEFNVLKEYQGKCQKLYNAKENLSSFSYGVLNFNGYDYLY